MPRFDPKYTKYMKKKCSFIILILISSIIVLSHCVRQLEHDTFKAVTITNKVLFGLFNKNYKEVFLQFHPDLLKEFTFEEFRDAMEKVYFEESGGIKEIVFDSYLPVLGQRAIQLYYIACFNSGDEVVIHFVLFGDAKEGYKMRIFDFGDQIKYPPNVKYMGAELKKIKTGLNIIINADTIIVESRKMHGG